ncbi:MAG: HYR domain-containing protein [Mariprofundaceae bacterium]|nr:HYR domain-containing protein [Mariprofundaceae bacterium]
MSASPAFAAEADNSFPPVITAPADARLIILDGNPVAASIGQAVATDNSGAVTVTNNAPATFPVGTTTVIWTATDTAGKHLAYAVGMGAGSGFI